MSRRVVLTGWIDVVEKRKLPGDELSRKALERYHKPYIESFWMSYNIVLENPADKEVAALFDAYEQK